MGIEQQDWYDGYIDYSKKQQTLRDEYIEHLLATEARWTKLAKLLLRDALPLSERDDELLSESLVESAARQMMEIADKMRIIQAGESHELKGLYHMNGKGSISTPGSDRLYYIMSEIGPQFAKRWVR